MIQAIPRVRLFLWQTCANALPVKSNMARRGSDVDMVCTLCGEEMESITHLLLYCGQEHLVWYASSLRIDMKQNKFVKFQDFLWTSLEHFSPQYVSILAYTSWEIWNRCNTAIFEKKVFQFHEVNPKARDGWAEYEQGQEVIQDSSNRKEQEQKWEKSAIDKHKLNTDIAVWPHGRVGFGFVLRDHGGNAILAWKKEAFLQGSSDILEGLAIKYALEEVLRYRFQVQQM